MYRVYRNQAAAAYLSLYFFIFLSLKCQTKFFVILFSGTVRPGRLILGTHVDSGQMYCMYWNQAAAAAYSSLYFFIFLSLQFSVIKIFHSLFSRTVRPRRLKLGMHVGIGRCIVYTGIRLLLLICPFISSVFFLSDFQALKKNLLHFSQELWGLESKNLVHIWIIGACNVCTGIRLLLLICPFIGPFFFLSNFSFIKLSFFSKAL